ncbi:uncharacterized protein LOC124898041 [Capsicum annuum]|uniref:uncharacterized protein LOC124898041 n=1 Tax=Capsicum annuum TaxID=4072 RepID=UPI001FB0F88E|nr:uncharacterized protein LOC124898041 [Capsicum annuum]
MGYSDTQKGYLLYDHTNKVFFVNRDVNFREDVFPFKVLVHDSQHSTATKLNETLVNWSNIEVQNIQISQDSAPNENTNDHIMQEQVPQDNQIQTPNTSQPQAENQEQAVIRRTNRNKKTPLWIKDFISLNIHQKEPYAIGKYLTYDALSPKYQAYIAKSSTTTELATYSEVKKDARWIAAMKKEITTLEKNKTWEITSLPEGRLQQTFKLKDLSELKFFLRIEFARLKEGVLMHQRKYALELVSELGLGAMKPFTTPIDTNIKLTTKEYVDHVHKREHVIDDPPAYQRLIGKLLYLTMTRPDIAYSVQTLSQFLQQPKKSHMDVVIRIVKHIKMKLGQGVLMYFVKFGESILSWKSKKQNTISRSLAEAECRSFAATVAELVLLLGLLKEIGINTT